MPELESPGHPDDLYQVRGVDADLLQYRPLFTGDVLRLDDGRLVALLQHPCSMRRGAELVPRLLAAAVQPWHREVPSQWTGHFRRMFLPNLDEQENWVIDFDDIDLIDAAVIATSTADRTTVLSQEGVNLLMQRWLHHQSRVVVPTRTINEMIAGQFDEADLTGDAVAELVEAGLEPHEALAKVDAWLGDGPRGMTKRDALNDPQKRSTIRADLRKSVRQWGRPGA